MNLGALNQTSGYRPLVWLILWAGLLGREFGKLLIEKLLSRRVVEDFPGHVIDFVCHKITVSLCDVAERMSLMEETADNAVITFVASTFATGIGMAIVDSQPLVTVYVLLHALTVGELGAVIHSDSLEGAFGKLRQSLAKGFHRGLSGLTEDTENNFIAGQAFCQNEDAFALAFSLAYYAVKLPMPEGGTGVYFLWTLFYAGAFGWPLSLYMAVFALFIWLLSQVFIADIRNIALVYVTVERGG